MSNLRFLVGQFFQETHSFNPCVTRREAFAIERGTELLERSAGQSTCLGGMIRVAPQLSVDLVPSIAARARPGGPVDHDFFLFLKQTILDDIERLQPDGVCLELHGAIASTEIDDCEGDLLSSIRKAYPTLPLSVALDCDGQPTPAMVDAADILVGYKTNPHSDIPETGEKALAELAEMVKQRWRTVRVLAKVPLLLQGRTVTSVWPLREIYARAAKAVADDPDLIDVSIFTGHLYLDIAGSGQAIVATSRGPVDRAAALCEELKQAFIANAGDFVEDFPPLAVVFERIRQEPANRPFVLGDFGDRVLAGAPGDSTDIIRYALDEGADLAGAIVVFDPDAVAQCQVAGEGATVSLSLGGRVTPKMLPVNVTGRVARLTDGTFVNRGPYMAGLPMSFGTSARIDVGRLSIVVTSDSPMLQDRAAYESFGIDVSSLDFLVVKSAAHFKLNFRDVGTSVVVGTKGLSTWDLRALPYRKAKFTLPKELTTTPVADLPLHISERRAG
ncbi:hypothetical protein AU467_33510 [Mesorhizobium loti]|uniref:Microcystinase C n=1 Tax=Rhizobium loti TaxID=381 RepID=A0A101KMA1_RHILI|nr:hypothetical protein AU467_33510 [Mesorhizobium loti]